LFDRLDATLAPTEFTAWTVKRYCPLRGSPIAKDLPDAGRSPDTVWESTAPLGLIRRALTV